MRIVGYNIFDGGVGRADPLAEVVLAQRPNIVALVEADDTSVLERMASRTKMDFIHARGGAKGAALLSHWTIRETIDHMALPGDGPRALLEATVVEPGGREWIVGVVHLSPRAFEEDERRREQEIAMLLERFSHHRDAGRPHLLVGDFNANSPIQQIDPHQCKPKTLQAWNANGGSIPRRAVQKLLDAGYVDTLDAANPEQAMHCGSFTTQHPGQRVDYIFVFGLERSKIQRAWIETDRLARYASDHFPVGAEITA